MSGPIIRKYGFPNFEKIFGDREIKHGAQPAKPDADRPEPIPDRTETAGGPAKPADPRIPDDIP